jgi:hypothetical protein
MRQYKAPTPKHEKTSLREYIKPVVIITILILLGLLFSGCQNIADKVGYIPKTKMEQRIVQLEAKHATELNKAIQTVEASKQAYLDSVLANFQNTADWLYGGRLGVELLPKDRLSVVIDYRLKTAASYAPTPSRKALEEMNITLKEELDESKTSIKDLETKYNQKVKEAKEAVELQLQKEADVIAKENELQELKDNHAIEIGVLKDEAVKKANKATQDAIAATEAKHNEAIEKNKRIIMATCGVLALAGLACAIWVPVFKKEAGQFAAITGGVALLVPFLQPVHLNIIYALGLIYVLYLMIRKHMLADRTNTNLINAVQDIKETKPEVYKEVQPIIAERNTKYVKGNEKKEDAAVVNHIDAVLRDYERK